MSVKVNAIALVFSESEQNVNIFMLHVAATQVSPYWDAGFPFLHPHMQWPSLLLDEEEEKQLQQAAMKEGH